MAVKMLAGERTQVSALRLFSLEIRAARGVVRRLAARIQAGPRGWPRNDRRLASLATNRWARPAIRGLAAPSRPGHSSVARGSTFEQPTGASVSRCGERLLVERTQ
jgi:hypothetical protein